MLIFLVTLTVGGLLAARLIPDYSLQSQRQSEAQLRMSLTHLRCAITMERLASATPLFQAEWSNPTNFQAYLQFLVQRNFLAAIPPDPTVPPYRWGTNTGSLFWQPTQNFALNGSFESGSFAQTSWATGSSNILASLSSVYPNPATANLNDFPPRNTFGGPFGKTGRSLLIIQK
jgi:soluble lytic murein transglycosylase-like protein